MDDTSPVTVGFLRQTLTAILAEHAKLAARTKALEERRLMSFEGAHDPAREYKAGSVVLRSGGVFVAMVATDEPPGSSSLWRQIGAAK